MAHIIVNCPKDPTKGVTVKVEGESGPGCKDLTRKIETALGKTIEDFETEEFHQEQETSTDQNLQQWG